MNSFAKLIRGIGWILMAAGVGIGGYVAHQVWFTDIQTGQAQRDLTQDWASSTPGPESVEGSTTAGSAQDDPLMVATDGAGPHVATDTSNVEIGAPFAALSFERDGQPVLHQEPLIVVEGVGPEQLQEGPGHYPGTPGPGYDGNVAIAGHRTTYGRPFWAVNELREGDTLHLVDDEGTEWVYKYLHQQVVDPTEVWVLEQDQLDTGAPTLTLTTCHPRFSDGQRLVVLAELVERHEATP